MKVVIVRPRRVVSHFDKIRLAYGLMDIPNPEGVMRGHFEQELKQEVSDMTPEFLDLIECVLDTLSLYGVKLDFFSLHAVEPVDECKSILIKVL